MSPKSRKKPPARKPAARSGGAKKAPAAPPAQPAPAKRLPVMWIVIGAILGAIVILVVALAGGGDSGTDGTGSGAASAALVARTKAADVPLLDAEGFATHTHTQLEVIVDGKQVEVPALIGIDEAANRIAALHTHDTTGLIHVESPKEHDTYTLQQFLTVWGMPANAAARCTFFHATAPCTITVTSKDSGQTDLDVELADNDTLTLTVTSG